MNALSELSKKRLISYACIMGGVIAWMLWGLLQPPTSGPAASLAAAGVQAGLRRASGVAAAAPGSKIHAGAV